MEERGEPSEGTGESRSRNVEIVVSVRCTCVRVGVPIILGEVLHGLLIE